MNKKFWFYLNSGSGSGTDADATAFNTAAGITDPTQQGAINTLVIALKAASLWTPAKIIYPFVGGTGSTHKYNLKDPRDLDAAFRANFVNAWTHGANGVNGNGTDAYANTFFNTATYFSGSNGCIGMYSRTAGALSAYDMGTTDDVSSTIVIPRYTGNNSYFGIGDPTTISAANADGRGFFTASRTSAINTRGYKNGVPVTNGAGTGTPVSLNLYFGAANRFSNPAYHSSRQFAFLWASDTLNDAQNASLYTAVQAFQTTLGRQV